METPEDKSALAAALGVPAFVRRARAVEAALEELAARTQLERSRRLRFLLAPGRALDAALGQGAELPPWAASVLELLRAEPRFGARKEPPPRKLAKALRDLERAVIAFNRSWSQHLAAVSLEPVHETQRDYNRYFPIEREAALRGVPQRPFQPLLLLERSWLEARFPPLAEPAAASETPR